MAKNNLLEKLKKLSGNEYGFVASDETNPYVVKTYVDLDCYLLNAALSNGNLFGGLPLGWRIIFGGESGVAKSLLVMYIVKSMMKKYPDLNVIFFESEGSTVLEQAESLKVDKSKILILPVGTIQDFKIQSTRIINSIKEDQKKGNKDQYMLVLDSLGQLGTVNEYNQALEGSEKKDMSKAGEIRSAFRNITLDLRLTNTPFLICNHLFANIGGYGSQNMQSGGKAPVYAGDIIFQITKAKEKEGERRVGSCLSLKIQKSRMQIEDTVYKLLLLYSKGLWKYSGLLELAVEYKIFKKDGNGYIVDEKGTKVSKKELAKNAEIYYTQEVLEAINEKLMKSVSFGSEDEVDIDSFDEED